MPKQGIMYREEPDKPKRITIDVIVTEERRIIDDFFVEYKLDCETNPPGRGIFSGYKTIEDLALAIKDMVEKHNISNPHYHIMCYKGKLPAKNREKAKYQIEYTYIKKPDMKTLKKLKISLRNGVPLQAHILYNHS